MELLQTLASSFTPVINAKSSIESKFLILNYKAAFGSFLPTYSKNFEILRKVLKG